MRLLAVGDLRGREEPVDWDQMVYEGATDNFMA